MKKLALAGVGLLTLLLLVWLINLSHIQKTREQLELFINSGEWDTARFYALILLQDTPRDPQLISALQTIEERQVKDKTLSEYLDPINAEMETGFAQLFLSSVRLEDRVRALENRVSRMGSYSAASTPQSIDFVLQRQAGFSSQKVWASVSELEELLSTLRPTRSTAELYQSLQGRLRDLKTNPGSLNAGNREYLREITALHLDFRPLAGEDPRYQRIIAQTFTELRKIDPLEKTYYTELQRYWNNRNDVSELNLLYREGLSRSVWNESEKEDIILFFLENGQTQTALELLDSERSLRPNSPNLRYLYALGLRQTNREEQAYSVLAGLFNEPSFALTARRAAAEISLNLKNYPQLSILANELMSRDTRVAHRQLYAESLFQSGNLEQAAGEYITVWKNANPNLPFELTIKQEAWEKAVLVLLALGKREESWNLLSEADILGFFTTQVVLLKDFLEVTEGAWPGTGTRVGLDLAQIPVWEGWKQILERAQEVFPGKPGLDFVADWRFLWGLHLQEIGQTAPGLTQVVAGLKMTEERQKYLGRLLGQNAGKLLAALIRQGISFQTTNEENRFRLAEDLISSGEKATARAELEALSRSVNQETVKKSLEMMGRLN